MDIEKIANECVNNLLEFNTEINIDDIYNASYEAVEDIIGDIALEIKGILEKKGININD